MQIKSQILILLLLLIVPITCKAQHYDSKEKCDSIVTNSFWDNWYGQIGVDMNLLFPPKHAVKDVFPNGKSFGVNIGVGKWFSPEFGGRIKVSWINGILKNDHNTWLYPYGVPGENHRTGGFITFSGDIQLNLHNLFGNYRPNKKWNIIIAPSAGGWIDIGTGKGCPILGGSFISTYRLNDKLRIYADLGYHFVASINGVESGTGHGGNSFADISVGIEMDISKENKFHKVSDRPIINDKKSNINSFWDNWFIQGGLGMSLLNPYKTNFANVFPNGSSIGLNIGIGKWFTPDVGVRGGMNWQNGLIVNHHATYLEPREGSEGDPNKHGFISLYADYFLNLHNIIGGFDTSKRWNAIIFPRMGIAKNFSSEYEESPLLGIGTEQTYKLNDHLGLFADITYQVVTSGFLDRKYHTGSKGLNSNGWFDINIGVQYELGQTIGWNKPYERQASAQMLSGHNWPRFIVNTGASVVVAYGAKTALKAIVKEERPDHSDNKSFPSGHAAIAFAAARSLDKEFRRESIWIPIAGYAAATAIGVERVVSDRHHWYDVVAGAGVGFGATELTWWLSDLMFGKGSNVAVGSSGNTVDVVYNF